MPNTIKFAIVFVVVGLHALRNLSVPLALAIYVPVVAYVSIQFVVTKIVKRVPGERWGLFIAFLGVVVMGLVVSLAIISPEGAFYGFARLVYALPVLFALYLYTDDEQDLRRNIGVMVVFFAVGSMTVPLQELIGRVEWFAPATERAGFERYASLIGSLTSVGIAVGCYILLTEAMPRSSQVFWIIAIAVPSVTSLSKAALANVALAILLIVYINRKRLSRILIGGMAVIVGLFGAYSLVPFVEERIDAVLVSFGVSNSAVVNYDDSFVESMIRRVTELPALNFAGLGNLGSPLVYLTGGGYGMADTALVPAEDSTAPMAHNQFAENFSVFGIMGGFVLNLAMMLILWRLIHLYRRGFRLAGVIAGSYSLLLINSIFANGTIYQPATASIFFLAMYLCICGDRFISNGESLTQLPVSRSSRLIGQRRVQTGLVS